MRTTTVLYDEETALEVAEAIDVEETEGWSVRQIVVFDLDTRPGGGRSRSQRPPRGVSTAFLVVYEKEV